MNMHKPGSAILFAFIIMSFAITIGTIMLYTSSLLQSFALHRKQTIEWHHATRAFFYYAISQCKAWDLKRKHIPEKMRAKIQEKKETFEKWLKANWKGAITLQAANDSYTIRAQLYNESGATSSASGTLQKEEKKWLLKQITYST